MQEFKSSQMTGSSVEQLHNSMRRSEMLCLLGPDRWQVKLFQSHYPKERLGGSGRFQETRKATALFIFSPTFEHGSGLRTGRRSSGKTGAPIWMWPIVKLSR